MNLGIYDYNIYGIPSVVNRVWHFMGCHSQKVEPFIGCLLTSFRLINSKHYELPIIYSCVFDYLNRNAAFKIQLDITVTKARVTSVTTLCSKTWFLHIYKVELAWFKMTWHDFILAYILVKVNIDFFMTSITSFLKCLH